MLSTNVSLSDTMADLPDDTCRLIATWTIPHLDREGRVPGSARLLRGMVVPLLSHITDADVERAIVAMCAGAHPLAKRYTDASGQVVLEYAKFHGYQTVRADREAPSRFGPDVTAVTGPPESSGVPREDRRSPPAEVEVEVEGKIKGREGAAAALAALFPHIRGMEGNVSVWADAFPHVDLVQVAKECRAKVQGEVTTDRLFRWFQVAAQKQRTAGPVAQAPRLPAGTVRRLDIRKGSR